MQANDPAALQQQLASQGYLADRGLATVGSICVRLRKPLLLEGPAGVGKTEFAKALAKTLGARMIRLQCYEGIDASHALYDWNFARQMLYMRALETGDESAGDHLEDVFGEEFLIRRPLLEALEHSDSTPPLLLIDEIDRADDEFEAFLLELLSDFQVTIPEIGTITAETKPVVIMTSNRTRDLHEALKRRCLYHWISHPSPVREAEILRMRVPGVTPQLAEQAAAFVARIRSLDLLKRPGTAETIDWVESLRALGHNNLDPEAVEGALGALLKNHEDIDEVLAGNLGELIGELPQPASDR